MQDIWLDCDTVAEAEALDDTPRRHRLPGGGRAARWWTRRGWVPIGVLVTAGLVAAAVATTGEPDGFSSVGVPPHAVVLSPDVVSQPGPPPPPAAPLAPHYEQVLGMAVMGETMVAVGERAARPRDQRPDLAEPLAWWSVDRGAHWNPASVPVGRGRLTGVAAGGGRFVAVGYLTETRGTDAIVLVSNDGRSWVEEPVAGTDILLDAVVDTPAGPILAGGRADLSGRVPIALVPDPAGGWRDVVLLDEAGGRTAEIRGACVEGRDVTLVGLVVNEGGERAPLVLRSSDAGDTWRAIALPGRELVGTEPRANGCAMAAGRTAVVGTAEVRGYDRAFVSVEEDGTWRAAELLEASNLQRPGHTLGAAVVAVGPDFVVAGHDSSYDEPGSDLAVWRSAPHGWARLDALDRLGAGTGVGVGLASIVVDGVLLVGGTSADRAVIWRSSPGQAVVTTPETTVTTTETWWAAHRETDACELVAEQDLGAIPGAADTIPRLSPQPVGPLIDCSWLRDDGSTILSVGLAPVRRFETFAASYPSGLPPPEPVAGICQEARYYPGFFTAAARCGDTLVAVSGPPREEATTLLRTIARRFAD